MDENSQERPKENATYITYITQQYGTYILIAAGVFLLSWWFFGSNTQITIDQNGGLLICMTAVILFLVYYWEKKKPKEHLYQKIEDDIAFFVKHRFGRQSALIDIYPGNNRILPLDFPSLRYFIFNYINSGYNILYGINEGFIGILSYRGDPSKAGQTVLETELTRYMGREAAHRLIEQKGVTDFIASQNAA